MFYPKYPNFIFPLNEYLPPYNGKTYSTEELNTRTFLLNKTINMLNLEKIISLPLYNATGNTVRIFSNKTIWGIYNTKTEVLTDILLTPQEKPIKEIPSSTKLKYIESSSVSIDGDITFETAINFLSYDKLPIAAKDHLVIVTDDYYSAVKALEGDTTFLCRLKHPVFQESTDTSPYGYTTLVVG